jgi:hypothetical protein
MIRSTWKAIFLSLILVHPALISAQSRGPQPEQPAQPQQPPAGRRAAPPPKPQPPMTLRQVIESLISLKSSARVEDLVSRRGLQFQSNPAVLDILKDFGGGPKLLAMIPAPPAPPVPPAPKIAGALVIACEPKDCSVVVNDIYKGPTSQNKVTVPDLRAGEVTVQVFADGYEGESRKIQLEEGKAEEAKFSLKRTAFNRQQAASAASLKIVAGLGGMDGLAELGDIEGSGTVNWTDSSGKVQEWPMTFQKRAGKDLLATFKTRDGQCQASILGQSAKQECKGGFKGTGEKVAEQAASLFLSYQVQDVMQTLLSRELLASEASDDRLESSSSRDGYLLAIGPDGMPADLIYRTAESDMPIQVQYSNYLKLNKGRFPGRTAIGRLNSPPVFVFTVTSVRTNVVRNR